MINTVRDFEDWPRTQAGDPIFTTSNEASFYAHLIVDKVSERTKLVKLRKRNRLELKVKRAQDNPNLNRMMELAVRDQFYRVCLEELERIEKEGN